ncbi:MAG: DUF3800 domain-containing protein [Chloroflexi bacterium]|nr:DUF3800 domain-containing protein [Chloroflexota bacterium]
MPSYFAGDEAGDVSFSFAKGASHYFVIALIHTAEPERLRDALSALRREHHLSETFEFSFHALTNPRLKENFFVALASLPFRMWAIIVDKRALAKSFRVMSRTSFYIYQMLADLGKSFKARAFHRGFKKIKTKRSRSERLIQCADLVAGALLARYGKGEERYLKLIREKLASVIEYPPKEKPPS